MRRILALLAVIITLGIALLRESTPTQSSASVAPNSTAGAPTSAPKTSSGNVGKGFRDRAHLHDHFTKHGREFSGLTEAQYLAMAQTLRDAPVGGDILEVVRASDGVASRFDRASGAFLAFDRDGTIRTFFKPNDGEKYFRRQANRSPTP